MKLSTTWKHWLKNHKDNEEHHIHYDKILNLLDTKTLSPQGCFNLIERRLENTILLTVSTEDSIVCSFYHERFGNPILDDSLKSICLTGFGEKAFPTLIETDKVLRCSDDPYLVPSWEDFMKIESEADIKNLRPSKLKKVKSFALLPPFFTSILLDLTKHFPRYYLLSFIKALKVAEKNAIKDEDNENLKNMKLFHDTFVFLWGIEDEKITMQIRRSKSRSLSSKPFLDWAAKIHKENLISEIDELNREEALTQFSNRESNSDSIHNLEEFEMEEKENKTFIRNLPADSIDTKADPDVEIPEEISPTSTKHLESVFHKLGSIIEKSMEKQSTKDSNYEDSQKKKAWKELDSSMKGCILNAGSSRGVKPASIPEDSLLTMITKKSPAKVLTHLYFVLNRFDIVIIQGLATALSRMILLSTPTWRNISNLSPFFVPPRNNKIATSANFLRLHVLEEEGRGYDDKDIDSVTSQTPKWTFNITGLRKQIRNFTEICALIFGKRSLLVTNLSSWDSHILMNEQSYEEYQISYKYFICSVLNKIHQRVQRFLTKCQEGWEEINWRIIDFEELQDSIVSEDYHVEKPSWVIEKDNKNSKNNNNSGNNNDYYNSNSNDNRNKRQKVEKETSQEINHGKDPRFNMPDRETKYGDIFTANVRKEFGKLIKNEDGKVLCHRYHIKGICDSNCRFKLTHKPISKDETNNLLEFVDFAFDKYSKSKNKNEKRKPNKAQG